MPYEIREMDGEFCVCTEGDGPIEGGCHPTKAEAEDHMKAMYANVEDASMSKPRYRLNLISEVALADDGSPRPIHILRTGTFTDMFGRSVPVTSAHLAAIVANFKAGKRKKPPITENHDFGRAVGRIMDVWSDDTNLYAMPKWNAEGKKLLADEVYDGFSSELERKRNDDGLIVDSILIGGSLTNYPAVDGLEPVTLSAPLLADPSTLAPPAPVSQARADTQRTTKEIQPMSDPQPVLEQATLPNVPAPALPPVPAPPAAVDAAMQLQLDAYVAQVNARNEEIQRAAFARAQAEFEQRIRALEQRSTIEAFARRLTLTTAEQPYAIPETAEALTALLLETPATVRGKWQALLTKVATAGPLSFDEIGSSGDGGEAADRWAVLVNAKAATGLSRVEAIKQVAREHPDLYDAQQQPKGRAR